ncbi:unnamed protein product, partial [Discosporangium mesarthrocarpum]
GHRTSSSGGVLGRCVPGRFPKGSTFFCIEPGLRVHLKSEVYFFFLSSTGMTTVANRGNTAPPHREAHGDAPPPSLLPCHLQIPFTYSRLGSTCATAPSLSISPATATPRSV